MCLNPINRSYVNYLGSRKTVACACGHCLECAQKYQNDWSFRLSCESLYWKHVYFITLTYDNENLPLQTISDNTYLSAANDALSLLPKTKSRVKFLNNKTDAISPYFDLSSLRMEDLAILPNSILNLLLEASY